MLNQRKSKPKYLLIVDYVVSRIETKSLKQNDWIPSVNEFRNMFGLSRDTVFTGLRELKSRGIIESAPGIGYYVASTRTGHQNNIFLLFNEFNEFKENLFNSFVEALDPADSVDIYFHNFNRSVFHTLLGEANGKYTKYVIMPGAFEGLESMLSSISGQVFLLDHYNPELTGKFSSVAQDFENDTYEALIHGLKHLNNYSHIVMVQKDAKEPVERYEGLKRFAAENGFGHEYINDIAGRPIKNGEVYMVVKDRTLVELLKQAEKQSLTPGREFGIISYNDTPLKEILVGGITTLSTDFALMGRTMAGLLNKKNIETIKNPWRLILRGSL